MKEFKTRLPELILNYRTTTHPKVKISSSKDAFKTFQRIYDNDTIDYLESVVVLFLNRANNTIGRVKLCLVSYFHLSSENSPNNIILTPTASEGIESTPTTE